MSKSDTLFVTDAECAKRIGITTDQLKAILAELHRQGFPEPDPLFVNRRYWPACEAFLDRRYGLTPASVSANPGLDGKENWS